jgi:hypothetical protein
MQPVEHPPCDNNYNSDDGGESQTSSLQTTAEAAESDAAKMRALSSWRWNKIISGLLFIAFITYVIGKCYNLRLGCGW